MMISIKVLILSDFKERKKEKKALKILIFSLVETNTLINGNSQSHEFFFTPTANSI